MTDQPQLPNQPPSPQSGAKQEPPQSGAKQEPPQSGGKPPAPAKPAASDGVPVRVVLGTLHHDGKIYAAPNPQAANGSAAPLPAAAFPTLTLPAADAARLIADGVCAAVSGGVDA